jgi:hypothetical protein
VAAVEAESAPELMPLPATVTVYIPALEPGGVVEPEPHPSSSRSGPSTAAQSIVSHFRRHANGIRPIASHSAQVKAIPAGSSVAKRGADGKAEATRGAIDVMVTVVVAVPFAVRSELAGLTAQVGAKAPCHWKCCMLKRRFPRSPG